MTPTLIGILVLAVLLAITALTPKKRTFRTPAKSSHRDVFDSSREY